MRVSCAPGAVVSGQALIEGVVGLGRPRRTNRRGRPRPVTACCRLRAFGAPSQPALELAGTASSSDILCGILWIDQSRRAGSATLSRYVRWPELRSSGHAELPHHAHVFVFQDVAVVHVRVLVRSLVLKANDELRTVVDSNRVLPTRSCVGYGPPVLR